MRTQPLTTVTAKVALGERDALERIARADDRTLSYVVRRLIREHLETGRAEGDGAPRGPRQEEDA
jgi:hypothetical protein